jgi:hypothetical protein
MQHILFLGRNGFFKRDFQRFQIKQLSKKFKVSFLDLSNLCNKKFYKKEKKNFFSSEVLLKIKSLKKFKNFISKNKISCVLDISNPNSKALDVFRKIINNNNIKLVNFQTSLYPIFKRNLFLKMKYFFRVVFLNRKLFLYYVTKLYKSNYFKKKNFHNFFYDLIFCIGEDGVKLIFEKYKKPKYIFANSLDFELFKNEKQFKKEKQNYILFLDQYLPFHNAYIHREIPPFATSEKYYKSLKKFFDFIEQTLKTKIIISAHPRSNYKNFEHFFGKRKVISYKKTNYFISRSLAVINYTSTAMNFAIIHNKPIIFYTSDEINNSHDAYRVNFLSEQLGSVLYNIDKFSKIKNKSLLKINKFKYRDYKNRYIRHSRAGRSSNLNKIVSLINEIKKEKI